MRLATTYNNYNFNADVGHVMTTKKMAAPVSLGTLLDIPSELNAIFRKLDEFEHPIWSWFCERDAVLTFANYDSFNRFIIDEKFVLTRYCFLVR